MEDCERNSKRRDEIAAVGSQSIITSPKKMKIQIGFTLDELNLPSPGKKTSPVTSSNSGGFLPGDISSGEYVSCRRSFSIESSLIAKDHHSLRSVVDLEAKSFETESSTCSIDNKFRETTPSSEFKDEMDSTTAEKKSTGAGEKLQAAPAEKKNELVEFKRSVSKEEIEKYLDEVEKKVQKQFTDKYNYDVVNDVPLEGRYEWVRLKP